MLKPDSHEFRVLLMRMKQLSMCALRFDCDNLLTQIMPGKIIYKFI